MTFIDILLFTQALKDLDGDLALVGILVLQLQKNSLEEIEI